MEALIQFKNLRDLEKGLKDEATCRAFYERIVWPDGQPVCPHCGSVRVYTLKPTKNGNAYKCADKKCHKKFNCLAGTIFENSKLPLLIWFKSLYLFCTLSKGLSSVNLATQIGVTQKTAWFIQHRLREMLKEEAPVMLGGVVEADETFIGGRETNKHKSKRSGVKGLNADIKIPVVGMVERNGRIFCAPVKKVDNENVLPIMVGNVKAQSIIYTDQWVGYKGLNNIKGNDGNSKYWHESVNHSAEEYVRGEVHTGTIDGAWSLFKRKINGIHHFVSPKHLHRYCNEFSFTYSSRKLENYGKFSASLKNTNRRLRYAELVGAVEDKKRYTRKEYREGD